MQKFPLAALVTLMTLSLAGCTGCEAPPAADGGSVDPVDEVDGSCVRDPALIDARRVCAATDDCPCGTYCSLGECLADCVSDEECAGGERCSLLGRCSTSADVRRTPNIDPAPEGELVVSNPVLQLFDASSTRRVRLSARRFDLGTVRVLAEAGLEVSCDDGGSFVGECRYGGLAAGALTTLHIKPTATIPAGEVRLVRLFTGSRSDMITVTTSSVSTGAGTLAFAAPVPVAIGGPLAGVYAGSARMLGVSVSDDPTVAGTEPRERTTLPIVAEVHAAANTGAAVLSLSDPSALLAGAGEWIGSLTVDGSGTSGTVRFPDRLLHAGLATGGAEVEVFVEAPTADVTLAAAGARSLSFTLVTRHTGILPRGRAPQTQWNVALFRVDDLPAEAVAPAVPADATPTYDAAARASTPTAWSAAANSALKNLVAVPDALFGVGDSVWDTFTGSDTNLVACTLEHDKSAVYQSALLHALGEDELVLRAGGSYTSVSVAFSYLDGDFGAVDDTPTSSNPLAQLLIPDTFQYDEGVGWPNLPAFPDTLSLTFTPEPVGDSLPCAFSGGELTVQNVNAFPEVSFPDPHTYSLAAAAPVDVCGEMAANYGCIVHDANAGEQFSFSVAGSGVYEADGPFVEWDYAGPLTVDVQRQCTFAASATSLLVARRCGELALCYDLASVDASGAVGASKGLGADVELAASGDLECDDSSGRGAMLDLDLNPNGLKAPALRNACLADLERVKGAPGTLAAGNMFADSECIDAARVLHAIDGALGHTRARAIAGTGTPRLDEETLAIRLLQRWVQIHGFFAQESAQSERLAQLIRRVDPTDPDLPPPVDDVLASSLNGWNIFFHPRFAAGLDALSPEALALADYRPRVAPTFDDSRPEGREQSDGVAVAMVDALTAQASLVHIHLERGLKTGDQTSLDVASEYLKHVGLLRPVLGDVYARAKAHAGTGLLPWEARYVAAEGRLSAAIGRVQLLMGAIRDGANPFGVEENDLPLYFFADETGAGGRFSAISDFLLGETPASATNFAPYSVRQAQEAMDDARLAWVDYKDRQTQRAQSSAELDEKLENIHLRFAGELTGYCGTPGGLATVQVLEGWEAAQGEVFRAERCYYKLGEAGCDFDIGPWAEQLTTDDILYQYCVADEVQKRVGPLVLARHEHTEHILTHFESCVADGEYPVSCPDSEGDCFACDGQHFVPSPNMFEGLLDGVPLEIADQARAACVTRFPDANPQLPGIDSIDLPALDDPNCYRGSIGEAALTVRAIAQDIAIARSEYGEFQERYDIAMNGCLILENGNAAIEAATESHNSTMTGLRAGKLAADIAANVAGGAKDCGATIAGSGPPWDKASAGVSCGAAAVEAAAESVSDGLQFAMDEAQAKHDALVQSLENATAEQQCYNDAEMELVGLRTASLRIQRAVADVQIALYQMSELKILAATAYDDGLGALAAAEGRAVAPLDHDYWLDEELERYLRRFRIASRITYLTVRAVEYEYQQTLSARGLALAAEIPDDLEEALDELWATAGTRRINGASPTDLKVVVSLKNHLLQLADNSEQALGEAQYSDVERLRLFLTSPRHEVYDDAGTFLGYQVPFQLAPLEALGLGNTEGIGIFARNSCAERLWSVTATIHGEDGKVFRGDDPSFVDVQLLKSNTFYSQWCTDGQDTAFQEASVRPSRNLFADPSAGSLVGDELGLGNEASLMSRARMQAFFNVDRTTFSQDQYANGDTSELAARGLYGQYAIFFPSGTLSVLNANGGQTNGLDLNAINDILLRLDYVSVAR